MTIAAERGQLDEDVTVTSASWAEGPIPSIAILISTFRRPQWLDELVAALEAQELPLAEFEVVLVDNGSGDTTWDVLCRLVSGTPLRMLAVRLNDNHGPARGRNAGAGHVRAPLIAITDDDCLPSPQWVGEVRAAFADPAVHVVQGRVEADPAHRDELGPWDHTIWVLQQTPFFETCNVAYRRAAYEAAGGFDETDPLLHPPSGKAFGEDACLAWDVQAAGGNAAFADTAVVHHRVIPATYRRWLTDRRYLRDFPGLAKRTPLLAQYFTGGVFLDKDAVRFDAAVAGVLAALASRRPWPLVASIPYLRWRWGMALHHTKARRVPGAALLARYILGDAYALLAKLEGTVKYRRLLL
jgi:GT2 family glycosyltransferase